MKSPFPGMDPYLEREWADVHASLIAAARGQINAQVGGVGLRARIEQRLIVEEPDAAGTSIIPDAFAAEYQPDLGPLTGGVGTATLSQPLIVEFAPLTVPQRYLEIIDPAGGRVITVIEFLSPSNKRPGDGREQYERKRRDVLDASLHLVEIDLTRAGTRRLACPPARLPRRARTTYLAVVTRRGDRPRHEVYPAPLRDRLPTLAIPLRPTDAPAALDLQSLIDQTYAAGLYGMNVYAGDLHPPLAPDDAAWAEALLAGAGLK